MPRGKYVNHKGRSRHFTSPEELAQESEETTSSEEASGDEDEERPGGSKTGGGAKPKSAPAGKMPTSSEESEEESEDDRGANKGVASLIEIKNPNRVVKKTAQSVAKLAVGEEEELPKPVLTRRERERISKQKNYLRYQKLHAEGKTAQAKADLARLALIKQQRDDAAAKREAEKKDVEAKKEAAGKA